MKQITPIILLTVLLIASCKTDQNEPELYSILPGAYKGSFNCESFCQDISTESILTGNLVLVFTGNSDFLVLNEIISEIRNDGKHIYEFILTSSGAYTISDGLVQFNPIKCNEPDSNCFVTSILSGKRINIAETAIQIDSEIGWFYYEKIAEFESDLNL